MEIKKESKPLERIVLNSENNVFYYNKDSLTPNYTRTVNTYYKSSKREERLSRGLWGFYNTISGQITINSTLSSDQRIFTEAHEESHSYGSLDESKTDSNAVGQTGKWYLHRDFGPPPIPTN